MPKPHPKAQAKRLEITIYDIIGPQYWGPDAVSAIDVKKLLDESTFDEIVVRLNSPGGNAYDGIAIYNLLAAREEKVIVEIDGLAASAASIVAMAGDEIRMAANALMMIHDAWTIAIGNAQDFAKESHFLAKMDLGLAKTYAARTGGDVKKISQQMDDETWFTAEEAQAAGLCDVITGGKEISAAFDLSPFKNAPADAVKRFGARSENRFTIAAGPLPLEQLFPSFEFKEEPMSQAKEAPKSEEQKTNPPPAPPAITEADVTKAKGEGAAAAKAAEKERSGKVLALCNQAGKPDAALDFINGDLSVADVQAKLFDAICKDRKPVGESGGAPIVPANKDPDAEAKQEYKANPHLAKCGISEEEFIAQKKRDQDHGYVVPKSVAKALAGVN